MEGFQILFTAPIFSLQLLIDGILIGAIFALAAYGMALVWGVMKIINFAQGEFVILGGFLVYTLNRMGVHPFLCVPLAAVAEHRGKLGQYLHDPLAGLLHAAADGGTVDAQERGDLIVGQGLKPQGGDDQLLRL